MSPSNKKRPVIIISILFICTYFLLFIPLNLTGTKDPNMLAIFDIDEYMQFKQVIRLTTLQNSFYNSIRNVFAYGWYFYGYPFFVVSGLSILPVRIFSSFFCGPHAISYTGDSILIDYTWAYMLILRQLNPLFYAVSIVLLVYLWNGFKSPAASVLLTIFLASLPSIFYSNTQWHPDSMAVFFTVLTIFSLSRDDLRFGKWFYAAAVFCGLAAGIKVIGLFFFLTVPTYILMGFSNKRISLSGLLRHGIMFLLVMASTIIITNPLLLIPKGQEIIFDALRLQNERMSSGSPEHYLQTWYTVALRDYYGFWWFYLLALCATLLGVLYDKSKRLLNIIILTWALPLSVYLLFCKNSLFSIVHVLYFLPVMLPLLSCIGNPVVWNFNSPYKGSKKAVAFFSSMALLIACGYQLAYYTIKNIDTYGYTLSREEESPALAFYQTFNNAYLSKQPRDVRLNVFRHVEIYLPPLKDVNDKIWVDLIDYDDINAVNPTLLFLRQSDIRNYSARHKTCSGKNCKKDHKTCEFYRDAKNDSIKGFKLIFETDYGAVFKKTG
jgi:hypothetical protein